MLKFPDDDTGRYSLFLCELAYGRCAIVTSDDESIPRVERQKRLRRPSVCLVFEFVAVAVGFVDEHVFLAMEKQMRRLVEQDRDWVEERACGGGRDPPRVVFVGG